MDINKKRYWARKFTVTVIREHSGINRQPEAVDINNMLCHNIITLPNLSGAIKVELEECTSDLSPENAARRLGEDKTSVYNNLPKKA